MFDKIGEKIQGLAIILFVLGALSSVIVGFCLLEALGAAGCIGMVVGGVIGSWVSALVLYGLGQLIVNSDTIARNSEIIAAEYQRKNIKHDEQVAQVKKQQEKKIIEEVKAMPMEVGEVKMEFVDITCPNCGNTLSFHYSMVQEEQVVKCPYCENFMTL